MKQLDLLDNDMIFILRVQLVPSWKATPLNPFRIHFRYGLATHSKTSSLPPDLQQQPAKRDPYWQKIPQWKDTSIADFLSYRWQVLSRPTLDKTPTYNRDEQRRPDARSAYHFYALRLARKDTTCAFGKRSLLTCCLSRSIY